MSINLMKQNNIKLVNKLFNKYLNRMPNNQELIKYTNLIKKNGERKIINDIKNLNKNESITYDIIYSVIFHQSVEFVNNFIKNIEKYNEQNNYLIIIHLSDNLFKEKDKIYQKNVFINSHFFDKKIHTELIFKSILQNCEYLIKNRINFNNFMTLSSSNRFIKQAPKFKFFINRLTKNKNSTNIEKLKKWYWYDLLMKNNEIVSLFDNLQIELIFGQVSGRLYPKNIILEIYKFIKEKNILTIIKKSHFVFDELILPSLAKYYMKEKQKVYCHIFYNKETNDTPTIPQLEKLLKINNHICIAKRFPTDLNHQIYKLI